ncbi:Aldo/keto reductase [Ramaria rubella]|nr:Aldo/keto reductase [Ramaria rubella]
MSTTRKIGNHTFPAIGFGAMGLSGIYGNVSNDNEERFEVLDRAHALGCIHWDTADIYGDSEKLIGKWFKRTGKRSDIFLASKFGCTSSMEIRGDAAYVDEAVNASLKKLGTDYIDLYYLHRVDKNTPIEETVEALAKFVKAGKVKYLGISECSSSALRRAHAVHPISAIQVEYSPFTLDIEDPKIALLATARELGVKVVAYSPLGRGFLTGQVKSFEDIEEGDFRKSIPMYRERFPKILQIADDLKAIGSKHGATGGQISLAWLLAQGDDIIPIPGTKNIKYLEENVSAGTIKLSAEEILAVRTATAKAGLVGASARHPLEQLFVDSPLLRK